MWHMSQVYVIWKLCPLCSHPSGTLKNSSSIPFQVPLAHNIFGLIGPNAGLGFAIGKWCPQSQKEVFENFLWVGFLSSSFPHQKRMVERQEGERSWQMCRGGILVPTWTCVGAECGDSRPGRQSGGRCCSYG